MKVFKWLQPLSMIWMACLVITNLTAQKLFNIGSLVFPVSILLFPITYIFADVFTEVYGYKQTRKIIWTGFFMLVVLSLFIYLAVIIPPSPDYLEQEAFEKIFYNLPLISLATIVAFWGGEFSNSYVLAKMKIWTKGKHLWSRTIGSSLVGQAVDGFLFVVIAYACFYPFMTCLTIFLSSYMFMIIYETAATPITYWVVKKLKKAEGIDVYDTKTQFNPFKLS